MLLVLAIILSGCDVGNNNKENVDDTPSAIVPSVTVYTGGYYSNLPPLACYWTNTAKTDLGLSGYVNAIFASSGHVYAGGYYEDNTLGRILCYWKDGNPSPTANFSNADYSDAQVKAIYVFQGHVFSCGSYFNGSTFVNCYWQDGNTTPTVLGTNKVSCFYLTSP
jgi:hypothetical protein